MPRFTPFLTNRRIIPSANIPSNFAMKHSVLTLTLFLLHQVYSLKECFFCLETCDQPMDRINCERDGVQMRCFSIEKVVEGRNFTEKGCLPMDIAEEECVKANETVGTTCSICDSDICNGEEVEVVAEEVHEMNSAKVMLPAFAFLSVVLLLL